MKKYTPIPCAFHDYLEHFATLKKTVTIRFIVLNETKSMEGVIVDLTGGRNGEYVHFKTSQGIEVIRMDQLLAVEKHEMKDYAFC